MNKLIVGVNGSGKTYKALHELYTLVTAKEKKYKHIYTNINGLNYEKINELAGIADYVKPFEFDDLYTHIVNEYNFFTAQKQKRSNVAMDIVAPVTDYDATCKEMGFYAPFLDSLIIIDECHLYFEAKEDAHRIRFLSYNRHFNIDTILITQNKNLISKKYLSFFESMYIALSGAKRFWSSRFRYRQYASYQEYHSNIVGTSSLSLDKNIAALYSSGSNNITKSAAKKFLLPVIVGFFVLWLLFKFFISDHFNPQPDKQNVTPQEQNSTASKQQKTTAKEVNADIKDSDKKPFFAVRCFNKSCNFKGVDYSFDENTMYKFINAFNCKIIIPDNTDPLFTMYVLRCDKDLQKVLNLYSKTSSKAVQNEETSSNPIVAK